MIRIVIACSPSGLVDTTRQMIAAQGDMSIVAEVSDYQDALELAKELKPAILLFSIDTLNVDSQALSRILRSRGKQHTHGVAIICPDSKNDALRAIRLGCSGTVTADASPEVVVECLRKVHTGETCLDPLTTTMLMQQFVSVKDAEGVSEREHTSPFELTALSRGQRQIVLMMGTVVRRAQRAEEASRAKSRVLANMSHELRTLLNAIIGFSELILKEVAGPINDRQREFLQDSLICGRELRTMINGILDLAKIEAGKMEVQVERLDPADLIRSEVFEVLRSTAILKGITLELVGSVGEVLTDGRKLKHIVENFVSNAIKYSPPNGRITVRVRPKQEDTFSIEVIDQGPGIEAEKIRLLFNRFQQLDEFAPAGSTGLGLALTKELAELLGGQVGVNSVLGKGSSFYVVLPVDGPPAADQGNESYAGGIQPRILVVEDESSDRVFLRRALARVGYRVDSAAHLRDAIKKCKTTRYDAITLDLVLGADDGTALLNDIGLLNQQTPVIVVSTTAKPPRFCQTRVYAQLQKPIQSSTLFESLNSAGVFPRGHQSAPVAEFPKDRSQC